MMEAVADGGRLATITSDPPGQRRGITVALGNLDRARLMDALTVAGTSTTSALAAAVGPGHRERSRLGFHRWRPSTSSQFRLPPVSHHQASLNEYLFHARAGRLAAAVSLPA
ncbi:MAG TPA: hypothetical protein VFV73_03150 [Streptosporangiaceae bacterium]|nr:hypothetical protein [Streptosporangiaceae bacterium]